jgi:hypothetical protein
MSEMEQHEVGSVSYSAEALSDVLCGASRLTITLRAQSSRSFQGIVSDLTFSNPFTLNA